jgi:hypothetical protein
VTAVEDPGCVTDGITTDGVTRDSVWIDDGVVEPVPPVCPSAAPASAACAAASCGVAEPFRLDPAVVDVLALVPAGALAVEDVDTGGGETAVTGFIVDDGDAAAAAVVGLCPPGLEPAEAVVAAGVPTPTETPPGACARAPRLMGGASSFITIFVWMASTTPEALRL